MGALCEGGSDTQQSQQVTQNSLPSWLSEPLQSLIKRSEAQSQTGYNQFGGQRVADFTPMQQQSFGQAQAMQGSYLPYLQGAAQNYNSAAGPITSQNFDQNAFQQYGNPYTQDVTDITLRDMGRQQAQMQNQLAGQAVKGGAFGGARYAIAGQELNRNIMDTTSRTLAGLNQANWQQAQGQFNADQNRNLAAQQSTAQNQLSAGTGLAGLGQLYSGLQQNDVGILNSLGGQQQAQNQALLDVPYQYFTEQQQYPYMQQSFLSSILQGLPYGSFGTQTTSNSATTATPSMLQQGMGAGMAGLGIAGMLGWRPFPNG